MPARTNVPAFSPLLHRNRVKRLFRKIKHYKALTARFVTKISTFLLSSNLSQLVSGCRLCVRDLDRHPPGRFRQSHASAPRRLQRQQVGDGLNEPFPDDRGNSIKHGGYLLTSDIVQCNITASSADFKRWSELCSQLRKPARTRPEMRAGEARGALTGRNRPACEVGHRSRSLVPSNISALSAVAADTQSGMTSAVAHHPAPALCLIA
jgi:hypothetical protein